MKLSGTMNASLAGLALVVVVVVVALGRAPRGF
jgi:hypothetical protein